MRTVSIVGAGVAGLCVGAELTRNGMRVDMYEKGDAIGPQAASWFAGAMLAPWCEGERAPEEVVTLADGCIAWWAERVPGVVKRGTIVVTQPRDHAELRRFAARTSRHRKLDGPALSTLEPDLAGRFSSALYFPEEGHLCPRIALATLADYIQTEGGRLFFGCADKDWRDLDGPVVDARGLGAQNQLSDLRGVRGEVVLISCPEITLSRPIRLLHPRQAIYVVPRGNGHYLVGATQIESQSMRPVNLRSLSSLLNVAYSIHPAFGEAEILELGAHVRPAFPDNLPAVRVNGQVIHINGMFRHGFLTAPALAQQVVAMLCASDCTDLPRTNMVRA